MGENWGPLPPPSCMVRKFLAYKGSSPQTPMGGGYFFFYGTLMDPSTLARVLKLSEPPQMRPARVTGYKTKLWGKYPALVSGEPFQQVDGLTYEIRRLTHWDRLVEYHSKNYDLEYILIDFLDTGEEKVQGIVFEWRGDPEELRDGSFSLEKWLEEQNSTESK